MTFPIRVRACALILKEQSVLLVEFRDEHGVHYNLPAGGVEAGESVIEATRREAKEEAGVDIEVGPVAFVYEYAPHLDCSGQYKDTPHGLSIIFDCTIVPGSVPGMPLIPDENQSDVRWVPLSQLDNIVLYPNIKDRIIQYAANRNRNISFIEDRELAVY
ncbi:NUDIX domain-containing protein [Paenibacillus sp. J5C_2022]|uniref:NUDIX domain-containing protein n=1 Tax=Paenibacillus sp. J5C2022 TaxID=2977129 RepID=UPI0021D0C715|nr:NUDIX domain-containing protein [Paenibacillus sp. J5C2022]MCU6709514.1 NUDIX domain-containing protein [Paenibacillus sp. J5C2022]